MTEPLLQTVLDLAGARVVLGDVGPDGSARANFDLAGDLIAPAQESAVVTLLTRMLTEAASEGEVRLVSGDGRRRWLRVRCRAVPSGEHPGHQGFVAVCADVTEEVDARNDERLRMARELHDGLGQMLTSAALFARSIETAGAGTAGASAAALRRVVEAAMTETKTVVWRRRPTDVEELGFERAMHALAETFRRLHAVRVDVHLSAMDGLSPAVEAAAYRVAQEAMTNAVKHAEPNVLSVVAGRRGSTFTLVVEDDGTGFDPFVGIADRGAGVCGMRERAAALNGRLDIESKPGFGTTVRLVAAWAQGARR